MPPRPNKLDERQRRCARARHVLLNFIRDYPASVEKAVAYLNAINAQGTLAARLRAAILNGNDRPNPERRGKLNVRTVKRWRANLRKRGTLAPLKSRTQNTRARPWHGEAIALRKHSPRLTLAAIREKLAKDFEPSPSYDQLRRFFAKRLSAGISG
jgi:transposase